MSDSKVHLLVRYEADAAIADCLDVKLNEELSIQSWGDERYALIENCKKERVIVNFQNIVVDAAKEKGDAFGFRLVVGGDQNAQRRTRHELNVLEVDDNAFFFAVFD